MSSVPTTPIAQDVLGYLRSARSQVLQCVDGLAEYELRRPMTPTGTNLLGVVKHLVGIEAGYLGACVGRPVEFPLPWITDGPGSPNSDMWATADESADYLVGLYRRACQHSDTVLEEVGLSAAATVPWWPPDQRETTVAALLARVLKDTAMHAGQLHILRELTDGQAGNDRADVGDRRWWATYVDQLELLARRFKV